MAEINEPTPVKPIWPARRERQQSKRKQPEQGDNESRKKERQRHEQGNKVPGIDEYV